MRITQWPANERPRERLIAHGARQLSDAELLAVLLGHGARGRDVLSLCRDTLAECGGLGALLTRDHEQCRRYVDIRQLDGQDNIFLRLQQPSGLTIRTDERNYDFKRECLPSKLVP